MVERLGQLALLLVPRAGATMNLELHGGIVRRSRARSAPLTTVDPELLLGAVQRVTGSPTAQAAQRAPGPAKVETASQRPPDSRSSGAVRSSSERS